jgi:hypothetical protein
MNENEEIKVPEVQPIEEGGEEKVDTESEVGAD